MQVGEKKALFLFTTVFVELPQAQEEEENGCGWFRVWAGLSTLFE